MLPMPIRAIRTVTGIVRIGVDPVGAVSTEEAAAVAFTLTVLAPPSNIITSCPLLNDVIA